MRCISPFDNGSYHMVTIRTNRTNRQLGEGSLTIQAPRNIPSPPNEMHFYIRQRVVSHGHDPYESNESTTRRRVLGMQLLRNIPSPPNEMHFSIRQRVVSTKCPSASNRRFESNSTAVFTNRIYSGVLDNPHKLTSKPII